MVAFVASIIATIVLLAPAVGRQITSAIHSALCTISATQCGETSASAPAAIDPHLSADERTTLLGPPEDAQDIVATLTPEERSWLVANDPEASWAVEAVVSWKEQLDLADRYMETNLDDFIEARASPIRDERLDWSTDECSAPLVGSTGLSFDFTDACLRHDFGYRNYKKLGVFDDKKDAVDDRFLDDMKDHCASRSVLLQGRCYAWAYTFYGAVRQFG
jgi:hypothetical protein